MPSWAEPQLATLTHERLSDPAWIFERKLDGERCLAFVSSSGLERSQPAFGRGHLPGHRGVHWVEPRLVGQIGFTEWPTAGSCVTRDSTACVMTRSPPTWCARCPHDWLA